MSEIINISLAAKSSPTINITTTEAGGLTANNPVVPVINYVTTGAIGPIGSSGADGTAVISDGSITSAKLAPNSVGPTQIISGSVGHEQIAENAIYGSKLLDGSISGSKLVVNSITSDKLQDNSISATKILDGSITRSLLSLDLITSNEIEPKSIYASNIANNTIVKALIADNSIDGNKIEDSVNLSGTVTAENLNVGDVVLSGTLNGIDIVSDVAANTTKETNIVHPLVETAVPVGALFTDTDTVYTHPTNHAISVTTGLQSALDSKVDDSQVLTDVPSGAVFTDTNTIYTHPANHAISVTTGLQVALDGKVDDNQVLTNVPSGALFTDTNTVYTHPANHAISVVTGLQTALDGKIDNSQVLTDVPSGALFTDTDTIYSHPANHAISVTTGLQTALDGKVDDAQVLTDVPSGALFTDTNTVYDATTIQAEVDLNSAKTSNIVQTTITGNAGTATALTSGNKTLTGDLNLSGATNKLIINATETVQVASGVVTIGQTNRVLNLSASTLIVPNIEIGALADTTIQRVSAGVISVEGKEIQTLAKHTHLINFGVNLQYTYARYIPIGSYYIYEQNTDSNPEYTTYVAPYDGKFIKALLRSEESLANTTLTVYKVGDGTEEPDQGSVVDTKTVNIASSNTSYTYTFDTDATFSKGDAISIKIQPTTDPVGAGVVGTFVLEFDLTT